MQDTALRGTWQFRDNATKARLYAKGVLRGDVLDPDYLALVTHIIGGWRGKGKEALPRVFGWYNLMVFCERLRFLQSLWTRLRART